MTRSDEGFDSRTKYFQNEQRKWLDQQVREKQAAQNREKYEDHVYAQQTLEINRMRGMLEDEFAHKKTEMKISEKDNNLGLVGWFHSGAREKEPRRRGKASKTCL